MKIFLSKTLVVEGKEDAAYLSNYISSEIVVVNGFELSKETLAYLKNKEVILLLDPDESGKRIREKINKEIPNAVNVEIDINKCDRGIKKGVAECQIDEVLNKLSVYIVEENVKETDIKLSDLYSLGLMNDKNLRSEVCLKLKLGNCNVKTFYKRLINNSITLKQLSEAVK